MEKTLLKREDLQKLIDGVREKGGRFVAPKTLARQVVYAEVDSTEQIVWDYIVPRNSIKEFFFPQTEPILKFRLMKEGVEVEDVRIEPQRTVLFGVRPCDAASCGSVRKIFTWDFIDEFYTKREDSAVIMTVACTSSDDECFCTTVGVSPEGKEGADIFLKETVDGDYLVEATTDKGKAFVEEFKEVFTEWNDAELKETANPEPIEGVDIEKIVEFLKDRSHYDSEIWAELARKCVGCGACTFTCPTCRCFDMVDEGTYIEGERRKNWDACQFDSFTLHASGHNPRDTQYKRWRNRFMCKFNFYPVKFTTKGCVGCGRCIRVCPVRLDITEVMIEVSEAAKDV